MIEFIDNFNYQLASPIKPTDTEITLPAEAIKQLNKVEKGNYVYISLHWLDKFEVVKFTKDEDLKLNAKVKVERDAQNLGSKNFPMGSCVKVQWNKITMDEYIAQRGA